MKKIIITALIVVLIIIYIIIVKELWIDNIGLFDQKSILTIKFKEDLYTGSIMSRIGMFFLRLIGTSFVSVMLYIALIFIKDMKNKN